MHHKDTFEEVAQLYADVRPGYPDALFAELLALARPTSGDRILEVGCGGGQATVSLARSGSGVLALDPGAGLVRAAHARLADHANVEFAVTNFESWPLEPGAFRLVAAAQAWHWVDPRIAYEKAASALSPDGWLAIFGHIPLPPAEPFHSDFEKIFRRHAPELWAPAPELWYRGDGPIAGLVAGSALFGPTTHRAYPWEQTLDAAGYLALCGTKSYFNRLPADQRRALFGELGDTVDRLGGRIEVAYETHLHMAQKLD